VLQSLIEPSFRVRVLTSLRSYRPKAPNQTVQRIGASRFGQRQIARQRRLAPIADLCVSCDMKLHSILLGWTGFLTKPCVSPQVFHGSMRRRAAAPWPLLTGVWSLPGNVANLAASTPGDALESEDTVKLIERS